MEWDHQHLSIRRQCQLLGLPRSTLYTPVSEPDAEDLKLMRLLDEQYLRTPFYGSRRMSRYLRSLGYTVNRKRVQRLMRLMGLEAIYPRRKTSLAHPEHKIFPYLLRGLEIVRPNQVWSSDITYVPMPRGFMFLVAVLDWYSRYVLSWRLSNTLETRFCLEAQEAALEQATPEIFNTDQGAQFTAKDFVDPLLDAGVRVSMDGRGRALDNAFIERLWRSVKYEDIYPRDYTTSLALEVGLRAYFDFYNHQRFHQSLGYRTPAQAHFGLD